MASAMLRSVGGFLGWAGSGVGQLGTGGSTGIVEKKDSEEALSSRFPLSSGRRQGEREDCNIVNFFIYILDPI